MTFEEKELSSFIDCLGLNEIDSIKENRIERILNSRMKKFQEINHSDLPFIVKFIELFQNNPIMKRILHESSETLV